MPIYKYVCEKCCNEFEELMNISELDNKIKCPLCDGNTHRIPSVTGKPVIN